MLYEMEYLCFQNVNNMQDMSNYTHEFYLVELHTHDLYVGLPNILVKEVTVRTAVFAITSLSTYIVMGDECIIFKPLHLQNFVML